MNLDSLKAQLASDFSDAACDYLQVGKELFFERRSSDWRHFQVSMGNLSIGLELLMKSTLLTNDISSIFKKFPPPTLSNQQMSFELSTGKYGTIGFNDCLGKLYRLRPELKATLRSHLRYIAKHRNECVHGYFPLFKRYDLERTAYASMSMTQYLSNQKLVAISSNLLDTRVIEFLTNFDVQRVKRVEAAIVKAQEVAGASDFCPSYASSNGWEEMEIRCSFCKSIGILFGENEHIVEAGEDGPEEGLVFYANEFICYGCGLALMDQEELRLAGMNWVHDRSDKAAQWRYEMQEYDPYDI